MQVFANDPVASIVLSDQLEGNNISLYINSNSSAEAYTEFTNKGGQECLFIPEGKYGYFRGTTIKVCRSLKMEKLWKCN